MSIVRTGSGRGNEHAPLRKDRVKETDSVLLIGEELRREDEQRQP